MKQIRFWMKDVCSHLKLKCKIAVSGMGFDAHSHTNVHEVNLHYVFRKIGAELMRLEKAMMQTYTLGTQASADMDSH